ncbi:MAG TPA: protein phosphatase 2C domain-containing protein [Candidatus Saccharimonadales bacterium]|nr:protein phosphatase 2C domain-containing protein [Candidatus Saccharimonadales bacterium]
MRAPHESHAGATAATSYEALRPPLVVLRRDQLTDPASALDYIDSAYPLPDSHATAFNEAMDGRWSETTGNFPSGVTLTSYSGVLQVGETRKDPRDCQDRLMFDPATGRGAIADGVGGNEGGAMAATVGVSAYIEAAARHNLEETTDIQRATTKLRAVAIEVDDAIANTKLNIAAVEPESTGIHNASTTLTAFQVLPSTPKSNARLGHIQAGDSALIHRDPTTGAYRGITEDHSHPTVPNAIYNSFDGTRQSPKLHKLREAAGAKDDISVRELPTGTNVIIALTDGILGNKPENALSVEEIGRLADSALAEAGIDHSHADAADVISQKLIAERKKTSDDGGVLTVVMDVEDARAEINAKRTAADAARKAEAEKPWSKLDYIRPSTLAYWGLAKIQSNVAGAQLKTGRQLYNEQGKVKRGIIRGSIDLLAAAPVATAAVRLGAVGVKAFVEHKGWGSMDFVHDVVHAGSHGAHTGAAPEWHDPSPQTSQGPVTTETSDQGLDAPNVAEHHSTPTHTPAPTPKPEHPIPTSLPKREAMTHDTTAGRKDAGPSTISHWVQQYYHDAMRAHGATEAQANASAHNAHNLNAGIHQFMHDNNTGSKGWLYAGHTYNVNGVHNLAEQQAKQWEAAHHPHLQTEHTAAPAKPETAESADQITDTTGDNEESAPTRLVEALPKRPGTAWYENPNAYIWPGGTGTVVGLGWLGIALYRNRQNKKYAPSKMVGTTIIEDTRPHGRHSMEAKRVRDRMNAK